MALKALQDVPRKYFGTKSSIHSMRARDVTVQQGQRVNQGMIRGPQGRRGDIPETYTDVENAMLQGAGNMIMPQVENLWTIRPPVGGGKSSSSTIRHGPHRAPPVGGGKSPRPPQPFPEDYGWQGPVHTMRPTRSEVLAEGPGNRPWYMAPVPSTRGPASTTAPPGSYVAPVGSYMAPVAPALPRYPDGNRLDPSKRPQDGDGSPWQLPSDRSDVECFGTTIPNGYPEANPPPHTHTHHPEAVF
jgi:hypothetical protein